MKMMSNKLSITERVNDNNITRIIKISLLILLSIYILTVPFIHGSYLTYIISLVGVYYIVSLGLNILTGVTGQLSLGHSGFFAVGAYGTAILTMKMNFPLIISIFLSGIIALIIGAIIAIPSLRVRGLYLAIVTLGFGVIVQKLILEFTTLTGGATGLLLENIYFFGIDLSSYRSVYYFIIIFALMFTYTTYNLLKSHSGRALFTIRDNEVVASSMGISVSYHKILSFCVSGFYTAVAGGLYAILAHHLSPEMFSVNMSIMFLAMIIIGGLGSIGGSLIGTAFYVLLPELLRSFKGLEVFIFGLFLLLTILFFPRGVWGIVQTFRGFKIQRKNIGN